METFLSLLHGATILMELVGLGLVVWFALTLLSLDPQRVASWLVVGLLGCFSLVLVLSLLYLGTPLVQERPHLPYEILRWVLIPLPLGWVWAAQVLLPRALDPPLRRLRHLTLALCWLLTGITGLLGPGAGLLGLNPAAWEWPFYPLYIALLLVVLLPLFHLARSGSYLARLPAKRDACRLFLLASVAVFFGAFYRVVNVWAGSPWPLLPGDGMLIIAFLGLGGAAALRCVAVGHTSTAAIWHHLAQASVVSLGYALVAWGAAYLLGLSWLILIIVVPLAVTTHWAVDGSRMLFERFCYRAPLRQAHQEMRRLFQVLEATESLPTHLEPVLARLAHQVGASALILISRPTDSRPLEMLASYPAGGAAPALPVLPVALPRRALVAATCPHQGAPVQVWAIPLVGATECLGVLLAYPILSRSFNDRNLALLEEIATHLSAFLLAWQAQSRQWESLHEAATRYREMAAALQQQSQHLAASTSWPDLATLQAEGRGWVEEVLRQLSDIGYLGRHPLATLCLVEQRLAGKEALTLTHLERGQALRGLCEALIQQLCPPGPRPREPYPATWRLYCVLHDAYIEGVPNQEIESRLYISTSTFNRARHKALDSVTKALLDLERIARHQP